MRGVLSVNKPSGISSYDVIRRIKPLLHSSVVDRKSGIRLGHAGTLDPMASGVLLILVGAATKVSRFLLECDKEYRAGVLFGRRTDTDDVTGATVEELPVPEVSTAKMSEVLGRFTGPIEQAPPVYSAIKQAGKPAYELARRGEEVETRPRKVTVYELGLVEWTPPHLLFHCRVSSGTYVRALARDIGAACGTVATLESLVRTRVGPFPAESARELDSLTAGSLPGALTPIADALAWMPAAEGKQVPADSVENAGTAAAKTADGRFLAIVSREAGQLRTERVIYAD
jgi:tRNA pseudouridine55 synthase